MRVSSLGVARPAYYDRNAVSTIAYYANTVGPHAQTTRSTTTVAAGKKLSIEVATGFVYRSTAWTSAGNTLSIVRITSGSDICDPIAIYKQDNTLNVQTAEKAVGNMTVYAGETVQLITIDNATGGTVFHYLAFKGTTYDA
jgi:hypothetical protein